MPDILRIHKTTTLNASPGWSYTLNRNASIDIDTGMAVGRMGTSIPSVFARIMLFETAFNSTPATGNQNGLGQQLVSEALDMLEFLYQNGNSSKLSTVDWIADTQTKLLAATKNPAIKLFSEAINSHLPKIWNPSKITLFFWTDATSDGKEKTELIGGTSLTTLVFTSANWSRKAKANGWEFTRLDGSKFFNGETQSLQDRNEGFRDMMLNLRMAFNSEFTKQCNDNNGIAKYIWNTQTIMNIDNKDLIKDKHKFLSQYPSAKGIYAGAIPVSCKQASAINSGYRIVPTSDRYKDKIGSGGGAVSVPTPLALNDKGLPGATYIGDSDWKPTFKIDEAHIRATPEIHNRELPGNMGIKYPYITAFDLLEDYIVKIPGKIDSGHFITLFNGESYYLLPLKLQFFDFFNISDLKDKNKSLVEITADKDKVTVTINMPITDSSFQTIPLTREYTGDSIVDTSKAKAIEIGFFPFYKVTDKPNLNTYSVVLASAAGTEATFFALQGNEIAKINSSGTVRTQEKGVLPATKYYDINQAFDIVKLEIPHGNTTINALVIPNMNEVTAGSTKYEFAVDLGTSNTYIAYKKVDDIKIETLSFNDAEAQTIFLYDTDFIPYMIDILQREFMLPTIGAANSIAGFPIKTTVCEIPQAENQQKMELFGNINIGFKFNHEINAANINNAKYQTDIKWALEKNPGGLPKSRTEAFCKQALWLIKNKALMNNGSLDFKVMITFPEAMIEKSVFIDTTNHNGVWDNAATELGLNPDKLFDTTVTESEAPYYMTVEGTENLLNIDIGGGTTDMFLVTRTDNNGKILDKSSANYLSIKFAANDLWGDGIAVNAAATGNNGFLKYLRQEIKKNNLGDTDSIARLVNNRSADVIAALFGNEKKFNPSTFIRQNNNLRSVLIIHYTALMFAVSRLLKRLEAGIPKTISFTGMGSKYLSLISTDNNRLKDFTAGTLNLLTSSETPHGFTLDRHQNNAKEVTAKGALLKATVEKGGIHIDDKKIFVDWGIDDHITGLTYKQICTGQEVNSIRQSARKVFDRFVELLQSDKFSDLTSSLFAVSVPDEMIQELIKIADQSYNNIQGTIPGTFDKYPVKDNLFFWFLKDSLCKLSASFYDK